MPSNFRRSIKRIFRSKSKMSLKATYLLTGVTRGKTPLIFVVVFSSNIRFVRHWIWPPGIISS